MADCRQAALVEEALHALALHLGTLATGRTVPLLRDFTLAFLVVTAVSTSATIWNARFSPTAGDELSGRKAVSRPQADG